MKLSELLKTVQGRTDMRPGQTHVRLVGYQDAVPPVPTDVKPVPGDCYCLQDVLQNPKAHKVLLKEIEDIGREILSLLDEMEAGKSG